MDNYQQAIELLPDSIVDCIRHRALESVEEIRLRMGQIPFYVIAGKEFPLSRNVIRSDDLLWVLERATGASVHSAMSSMRNGYFSYKGLRIGLCGEMIVQNGKNCGFQNFSSLSIRIPRECHGICDKVMSSLYQNEYSNTLILAPPGGGKTTVLRELVRCLSQKGYRIGVVDERNELSGMLLGQVQFDLGAHTDILVNTSKAEGAVMLLRAMNPQIIAMDEITRGADGAALREIAGTGVGILATAHASDPEDLYHRSQYREILEDKIFHWTLTITLKQGGRSIQIMELAS